jgi:hypothetical protein
MSNDDRSEEATTSAATDKRWGTIFRLGMRASRLRKRNSTTETALRKRFTANVGVGEGLVTESLGTPMWSKAHILIGPIEDLLRGQDALPTQNAPAERILGYDDSGIPR